jgi:hypothetical protein
MRDDAVRTTGIASVLNFEECPCVPMERMERGFEETVFFLNIGYPDRRKFAPLDLGKEITKMRLFHIPQHMRHPLNLCDSVRFHVCITSGDNEKRFRAGSGSSPSHLPRLKISAVGDGAGVDNSDIRRFSKRDKAVSLLLQGSHQGLGFKLVDFATQCSNSNCRHIIIERPLYN